MIILEIISIGLVTISIFAMVKRKECYSPSSQPDFYGNYYCIEKCNDYCNNNFDCDDVLRGDSDWNCAFKNGTNSKYCCVFGESQYMLILEIFGCVFGFTGFVAITTYPIMFGIFGKKNNNQYQPLGHIEN